LEYFVRKTKIIITLGPATQDEQTLQQLISTGVNVFRLNMSHADHDWVREKVKTIRRLAAEMNMQVAILMDLQGPSIRTGDLKEKIVLKPNDFFTFTLRGHTITDPNSTDTNYDDLMTSVNVGDIVIVDNGVIQMRAVENNGKELRCQVLTNGLMGSRRHINLPGIEVNLPGLTEKDLICVDLGIECDVDYIAMSFVRYAKDVLWLKDILKRKDASQIKIISKIEEQSAIRRFDEILGTSDGIMVARGDLGVELPYEELPIVQRKMVKQCVMEGKPVIVATQMLESMIVNPVPTRAEVTDVANAVYEETDAIMLSGETATGAYPVDCVKVLDTIAQRIERSGSVEFHDLIIPQDDRQKVAAAAVHLADSTNAEGILVFTKTGRMARACAMFRPHSSQIFSFTEDEKLARRLCLHYGVMSIVIKFESTSSQTIHKAEQTLISRNLVEGGKKVVVISDILSEEGEKFTSVQLRTIRGTCLI
jgi:pyruvate kinase